MLQGSERHFGTARDILQIRGPETFLVQQAHGGLNNPTTCFVAPRFLRPPHRRASRRRPFAQGIHLAVSANLLDAVYDRPADASITSTAL